MRSNLAQALGLALLVGLLLIDAGQAASPEFTTTAGAELHSGIAAYQDGDYNAALELLEGPAGRGNVEAQRILGIMYLLGKGTATDPATAGRWIRGAAYLGDAQAQELLSFMHNQGVGVPQDYVMAYVWLKLAIIQNHEPDREQARQAAVARLMTLIPKQDRTRARNLSRQYYNRHVKPFL
jgi:TPR repeat protein